MFDNISSLRFFAPELALAVGILAVLAVDLARKHASRLRSGIMALCVLGAAAAITVATMDGTPRGLFGGLIARDPFADFFKLLFLLATALVAVTALRSHDAIEYRAGEGPGATTTPNRDAAEFYALLLTTTLGMLLMAAATDLLMVYLSLELVSLMSYILAGYKRRDRKSSEAALKYVIYGAVASGVMLYGMSLLYGLAGSTNLTAIHQAAAGTSSVFMLVVAVTLTLCGFGYKIAAVPFHMWCPDVYEGAPTPITAFLSVGPKAAGFALLLRFFAAAIPNQLHGGAIAAPWPLVFGAIAAATMTLGNLAAIVQSNLKRMLAYSSIAHAGYMLLGVCAMNSEGERAILIYLVTYLFMNLGAFVVILGLADAGVGENIDDWRGIGYRARLAGAAMAIFLFSLTGLPPFAGFFGKFYIFAAVLHKGGTLMVTLALIGIANSAVSLYYYARVLKAMYFDQAASDEPVRVAPIHKANLGALAALTLGLFVLWTPLVAFVNASLARWAPHLVGLAQLR